MKEQVQCAGERLRRLIPQGFEDSHVFCSPLLRARMTAQLAGFEHVNIDDDIAEWDYGAAEGRTREYVSEHFGRLWDIWEDGPLSLHEAMQDEWEEVLPDGTKVCVHAGQGESVEQVGDRVNHFIERVLPTLLEGNNVLAVAHAHVLRILTMQWVGMPVRCAKRLRLDTASIGVLSFYKGDRVIERWNV